MLKEPVRIEDVLKSALAELERYPSELESLQRQLHNITKAAQQIAAHWDFPVSDGVVEDA